MQKLERKAADERACKRKKKQSDGLAHEKGEFVCLCWVYEM